MPDLIIKPSATSGNKLILKDQAGGVVLQTQDSGISALAVPSGYITNVFRFSDTGGNLTMDSSTVTVACDAFSFSAVSGRHYCITGSQYVNPWRDSSSHNDRWMNCYLYYGTTDRALSATTVDTKLSQVIIGRHLTSGQDWDSDGKHYAVFSYTGFFTAGSTATHYVYTAVNTEGGDRRGDAYNDATYPHNCIIFEVMP